MLSRLVGRKKTKEVAGIATATSSFVANIVTFLMVFVIRNTQNRDTAAMHIANQTPIRAEVVPKRPAKAKAGKS